MSTENAEKLAKKIEELPPLPLVVQKLLAVVGDDGSSASDVGEVLSADQALVGKVLKLVNSAFYGLPGKIPTITRAVVILGYSAVRNLAFASYDTLKSLKGPVDQEKFWSHALSTAVGAQVLASHLNYPEAEEAFIAGLLHDIGHLVLSSTLPDEYAMVYENMGESFLEMEEVIIGMTHMDIGTRLLEHWQIPEKLCRVARFHHSPKLGSPKREPLVSMVMLADVLSSIKGSSFAEFTDEELFFRISNEAGLSAGSYSSILSKIDEKIGEAMVFLKIAGHSTSEKATDTPEKGSSTVLIIGDDEERVSWVKALLDSFGYHVMMIGSQEETTPDFETVQLAILDPMGIPEPKALDFTTLLKENNITGVALSDNGIGDSTESTLFAGYPALPIIFSREDINALLQKETTE